MRKYVKVSMSSYTHTFIYFYPQELDNNIFLESRFSATNLVWNMEFKEKERASEFNSG